MGPSGEEIERESQETPREDLNPEQQKDLISLRWQFQKVFSKKPGKTNLIHHHIKVKGDKVVRLPPRRWPQHLEETLVKEVELMRELGVIEPSNSEWRSHPVLVPKADGKTRVSLDFRRVNEVSEFDAYPMPRIQGLIEKLGQATYLTTLWT